MTRDKRLALCAELPQERFCSSSSVWIISSSAQGELTSCSAFCEEAPCFKHRDGVRRRYAQLPKRLINDTILPMRARRRRHFRRPTQLKKQHSLQRNFIPRNKSCWKCVSETIPVPLARDSIHQSAPLPYCNRRNLSLRSLGVSGKKVCRRNPRSARRARRGYHDEQTRSLLYLLCKTRRDSQPLFLNKKSQQHGTKNFLVSCFSFGF